MHKTSSRLRSVCHHTISRMEAYHHQPQHGVWIFALAPCLRLSAPRHICVLLSQTCISSSSGCITCIVYLLHVQRSFVRLWVPDTPRGVFFRVVVVYQHPQAMLAVNARIPGYWSCCFHALSTVVDSCWHIQPVPGIFPTCPLKGHSGADWPIFFSRSIKSLIYDMIFTYKVWTLNFYRKGSEIWSFILTLGNSKLCR